MQGPACKIKSKGVKSILAKKVIIIRSNIFGAVLACAVGVGIAAVNYLISRYVLKKHPAQYAMTPVVRQLIQVAYLVVLFFFGDRTPWDKIWLLAGGCIGITVPMLWFTYRLVKLNDDQHRKEDRSDG